jgi:DNA polymerase-3 subunit gamma/tau
VPHDPHYTVLARRFRPQTFDEVVGQEHVGRALQNAIRAGRVAHAYLFTGARGVGKTSTARIFAKALNCPQAEGGVPCNECDVCRSISAGSDVDVLEIDGASNRGIDDIRTLRANVNVRSMRSRYKVYIIDEVHMLTKEAFNALLKTLEEPPPNVKFVFCTTEPNKVPDTILSRCQRFDFGIVAAGSIAARLQQIADIEGIEVESEAIELVARRAAGSMRDSQSLFDQLLAFGEQRITCADVHRLLGTAPDDRLADLVDALIDRDRAGALGRLDQALSAGVQLGVFGDQLLEYLRDLLVVGVGAAEVPLLSVAAGLRPRLEAQTRRWGLPTASAAMQVLAETKGRMQRVNYGRALLELALVRISMLEELDDIAGLIQDLQGNAGGDSRTVTARSAATERVPARASPLPPGSERAKKNGSDAANQLQAGGVSTLPPERVPVPLQADSVDAFWAQLLVGIPDTLAKHLKNASQVAISGPNALEIVFPKSYLLSKQYCERPETLARLQAFAADLAGHPVQCRARFDEALPANVAGRPMQPVERRPPEALVRDPFVQQVLAVFGGTVVDVRPVSADAGAPGEDG